MRRTKRRRVIAVILLLAMFVSLLPAGDVSAKASRKNGPVLKEDSAVLYQKNEYASGYRLQIENVGADATITYKTSNKKIATVSSDGYITPVKMGKAKIPSLTLF